MIDEDRPQNKRRCKAMVSAGINDPVSYDGIHFCTDDCPYDFCVVLESHEPGVIPQFSRKAEHARKLKALGAPTSEIATILGVRTNTIRKYFRQ